MLTIHPMGFYQDLKECLAVSIKERFGAVPYRLAKEAGTTSTQIDRILKGTRKDHLEALGKIMDAAGVKAVLSPDAPQAKEYVFIEKAEARLAAGGGSLESSGEIAGGLMFKLEWLTSRTRSNPKKLKIMEIDGSSMSPTIEAGDVVLVDEGNKELIPDKVYAIRKDGELYVKRYRKAPGEMIFMGDNRARDFEDVRVSPGDEDGFAVIGRVLWAGKEL